MSDSPKNHCRHMTINIIISFLLIVACILIFVQTIINIKYNYSKNKTIFAEKLVYEQFSHDVYSNVNSKILYDFELSEFSKDCPEDKEPIAFSVKLDSDYDCEDSDIKNESNDDEKKKKCIYYNKYNGKISQIINGYKICAKKYDYDYQYLLYLSKNNNIKSDCIYIDSYNHCLNEDEIKGNLNLDLSGDIFSLGNKNAIVKNIFSEIIPDYFEYETILKELMLNNKIKISDDDQKEVNNYNELNIKNIYDAFFNKLDEDSKAGNIYYNKQKQMIMKNIMNNNKEPIFDNYKNKENIKQKNISWYTRNYIGFANFEELSKFKEIFDENDVTNNPLYQMSNNYLYPSIESIFIIIIFLVEFVVSIIIQIKSFRSKKTIKIKPYLVSDSLTQIFSVILLIIYFSIYLFEYVYKYKKIGIEMEIYYQLVLEQYNKRRNQDCLFAGIIILFISLVLLFINYILMIYINNTNGINPSSGNSIICTLRNEETNDEYQFKFYLNRKFSVEKERFEEKYFKNFDIEKCKFRNIDGINDDKEIVIDEDKRVGEIGLKNQSLIYVVCEPK